MRQQTPKKPVKMSTCQVIASRTDLGAKGEETHRRDALVRDTVASNKYKYEFSMGDKEKEKTRKHLRKEEISNDDPEEVFEMVDIIGEG